jgi:hypothetical protein
MAKIKGGTILRHKGKFGRVCRVSMVQVDYDVLHVVDLNEFRAYLIHREDIDRGRYEVLSDYTIKGA